LEINKIANRSARDQNVLLPYGDRSRFGFKGEGIKVKTSPVE
jgi:hypothetical protein